MCICIMRGLTYSVVEKNILKFTISSFSTKTQKKTQNDLPDECAKSNLCRNTEPKILVQNSCADPKISYIVSRLL